MRMTIPLRIWVKIYSKDTILKEFIGKLDNGWTPKTIRIGG